MIVNKQGSIIFISKTYQKPINRDEQIKKVQLRKQDIIEEHRTSMSGKLDRWNVYRSEREVREFIMRKRRLRENHRRGLITLIT